MGVDCSLDFSGICLNRLGKIIVSGVLVVVVVALLLVAHTVLEQMVALG